MGRLIEMSEWRRTKDDEQAEAKALSMARHPAGKKLPHLFCGNLLCPICVEESTWR